MQTIPLRKVDIFMSDFDADPRRRECEPSEHSPLCDEASNRDNDEAAKKAP